MTTITEAPSRDYAGLRLRDIDRDGSPLPDYLDHWVRTGTLPASSTVRTVVPNPYDSDVFTPTGDVVQAWRRRFLHLSLPDNRVTFTDQVEWEAMRAVDELQAQNITIGRTLEIQRNDASHARNGMRAIMRALDSEAEERDWCEEYDTFLVSVKRRVPGEVAYILDEFERTKTVKVTRSTPYIVWIDEEATMDVPRSQEVSDIDEGEMEEQFSSDEEPSEIERWRQDGVEYTTAYGESVRYSAKESD